MVLSETTGPPLVKRLVLILKAAGAHMPATFIDPGVYLEEVPSGARTIEGVTTSIAGVQIADIASGAHTIEAVPTSIAAFVGRAGMGPVEQPVRVDSFDAFRRLFGGVDAEMPLTYSVQQFFQNGGADAVIVRLVNDAQVAAIRVATTAAPLILEARSPGAWGNGLRARVDRATSDPGNPKLFNLTIELIGLGSHTAPTVIVSETFADLSIDPSATRYVVQVLEQQSSYVAVKDGLVPARPPDNGASIPHYPATGGSDGAPLDAQGIIGRKSDKTGIYALENADIFNLLIIPPLRRYGEAGADVTKPVWDEALNYCRDRRAMLLVDPPESWRTPVDAAAGMNGLSKLVEVDANAAIYWPFLQAADPMRGNQVAQFAPSGAVAGVIARTDGQVGVWKAAAGQTLRSFTGLSYGLTDADNGLLNPLALNCLRTFSGVGHVVWGARTIAGAEALASEWKYLPIRRTASFVEESLHRGLRWVVFEPNAEPLWAQIRLTVGAFMQGLFQRGAFQGVVPEQAYFVKCDATTNSQSNIDSGILMVVIGFAPLKPAEFVIIQLQQMAGQTHA